MDVKMLFRKTSNYNCDIVVEDFNGNQVKVCTAYATFTTGESVSKTMIIDNAELYNKCSDEVHAKIKVFNEEVEALAQFHGVPIV